MIFFRQKIMLGTQRQKASVFECLISGESRRTGAEIRLTLLLWRSGNMQNCQEIGYFTSGLVAMSVGIRSKLIPFSSWVARRSKRLKETQVPRVRHDARCRQQLSSASGLSVMRLVRNVRSTLLQE